MKVRASARWVVCRFAALAVAVAVVAASESIATACPLCKQALASHDRAQGDIVAGYFWSILFMMSMPFLILGSLGGYLFLEVRRARARPQAGTRRPSPDAARRLPFEAGEPLAACEVAAAADKERIGETVGV